MCYGFEELTNAQALVYDKAHLSNTGAGQTIAYEYHARSSQQAEITDLVLLTVESIKNNDKRDIKLDFLTGERRMALPIFQNYRGNPIIIVMLEHIAQTFSRETGGGVIYFRNRIRDGLASDAVRIEQTVITLDNKSVQSQQLHFSPFKQDPYLAKQPKYLLAEFSITLSEQVPGGVISVAVRSTLDDQTLFDQSLKLDTM